METVLQSDKTRKKCQVFTPDEIVNNMLDYLGYHTNLMGKKVLENACGDGHFLKEIVRRYVCDCRNNGVAGEKIVQGLSEDIYGIEIDQVHYESCLAELDKITKSYGINGVKWSIFNRDALREPIEIDFDYIVGNPPYISYWDLDNSEREFIKEKYSVCRYGACDYSYAFIQEALSRLKPEGRMAYIVPNSIFKTKSGRLIRESLLPAITNIYDYTTTKVFSKVLTASAIIVVDSLADEEIIVYSDISQEKNISIRKSDLGDIWTFTEPGNSQTNAKHYFGDCFHVAASVATQCNKAFVLSGWIGQGKFIVKGNDRIEMQAVRKAASPKGKKTISQEYIIFPYISENGVITRYSEADYRQKFPLTYIYLLTFKEQLEKRAADEKALWFEYGRSQALSHINAEQLLISSVITDAVKVYEIGKDEVPYSGIYITAKDTDNALPLDDAKAILQSDAFFDYLKSAGINASGKSFRITVKNICDYRW